MNYEELVLQQETLPNLSDTIFDNIAGFSCSPGGGGGSGGGTSGSGGMGGP